MKLFNRGTWEVLFVPAKVNIIEAVSKSILMTNRKSDGFIVLKKQSNVCGGKEATTSV